MSNTAKVEIPGTGDNGLGVVYVEATDEWVLSALASAGHAHAASAISFSPTGSIASTDVQAALAEVASEAATATGAVATDLANHLADAVDAHDASAISFVPTGTIAATDVQAALAEAASEAATNLATHEADTTSVHGIANTALLLSNPITSAVNQGTALEVGNGTQALQLWAEAGGPSISSKDDSRILMEAQTRWDSDDDGTEGTGIDINKPAIVLRQTVEDHKGALIEWQQWFDAGLHDYGIACNTSGQFNIASAGYKRTGWILNHYNSPNPADGIHQHMNFETVQSDFSTIVTRFQISYGEDIALASFPNSHVKVFDNLEFRLGSDNDAIYKFDTATGRLLVSGVTHRYGNGTNFVWIDQANGRLGVGPAVSSPSAPLHLERTDAGQSILARNTAGGGTTGAVVKVEAATAGSRGYQSGIQTTDSVSRFNIDIDGGMAWGPGGAGARDTTLYRSAADSLKTDDAFDCNSLTIAGTAIAEVIRDTIGSALVAGTDISISVNDGADTITINAVGVPNIAYGTSAPGSPAVGDFWLDTN